MLCDGLGRVESSVLVKIDDARSACCPVSRDPRKAYRSTGVAPATTDGATMDQSGRQDAAFRWLLMRPPARPPGTTSSEVEAGRAA